MNRISKLISFLLALVLTFSFLASCGEETPEEPLHTDFASAVTLDMMSETKKLEVNVKSYVDGDTTHFYVPESEMAGGVLKARYLAINTPESTGKIEEWGKAASNFTREKLEGATSIIIESEDGKWNADSTGGRYLVWVWYQTEEGGEYRNLNIEILQNGLAIASNSANNRYGDVCMKAIAQARSEKLHVYSGAKDPNFPYGEAAELTLKELRCNVTEYNGAKVAFEGIVTKNHNNSVYIEEYDPETDLYFGMTVYYGYSLNGTGLEILSVGNRVRIVGTVQYYETGDAYQVSGLEYSPMRPTDPNNIRKISEGHSPAYRATDAATFKEGSINIALEEETREADFAALALYTSVEMRDLRVKGVYTTNNEESSQNGAMTITCEADGYEITVRTAVLWDENGEKITADIFENATIDVKGLIDCYDGEYQIKVFSMNDITLH